MKKQAKLVTIAVIAVAAMLAAVSTCGGPPSPRLWRVNLETAAPTPDGGLQSTDSALAELDAMPCPEGVDEALWAELKGALEEALLSKEESRFSNRDSLSTESRLESRDSGGRKIVSTPPTGEAKMVSTPPTGEANRVDDLAITDHGDGTFTLTWHYRNLGDYGQDGVVALEDIIPLAEHFGESVPETDTERNSLPAVIDGSGNGKVDIADVTPIAVNFQRDVHHYVIEGADSSEGPWSAVGEVAQDAGAGDGRLEYTSVIQSPAALWHRVVPYDSEGSPGEPSNAVLRPSNEPIIYDVSPTEGYQHEECTFSAAVTGVEPLTYAWDFGGGAEPDTSSGISPTVTLSEAGEYEATLSVTNAYGETSHPFTLTVSARDIWAHTWDGPENSNCYSYDLLLLEDDGSLYIGGLIGAHSLIMKWTQDGNLIWARTWGGEQSDYATGLAFDASGSIIAAGSSRSFGEGRDDLLLLKYSPDGELLQSLTWGTSDYERAGRQKLSTDAQGNIYICGYWVVYGGEPLALIVKFDPDWNVEWAKRWGGAGEDRALGILARGGAVYVCGETGSFGNPEGDAFLMKMNPEGEVLWARTWGTECAENLYSLTTDGEGNLYAAGHLDPRLEYGQPEEGLLMSLDQEGGLHWAKTWAGEEGYTFYQAVSVNPARNLTVVGDSGDAALVQEIDPLTGSVLVSWKWEAATRGARIEASAFNGNGDVFLAGRAFISNDGEWLEAIGAPTNRAGAFNPVEGTIADLSGVTNEPEGVITEPEGVIDIGSGEDDSDVLILKNYPK